MFFTPFLTKYKVIILGIVFAVLFSSGFYGGYKIANASCKAEQMQQFKDSQRELEVKEQRLAELEASLVEANRNTRIVYRDNVIEVVKYVDNERCLIDDAGVQLIKCSVTGSCE